MCCIINIHELLCIIFVVLWSIWKGVKPAVVESVQYFTSVCVDHPLLPPLCILCSCTLMKWHNDTRSPFKANVLTVCNRRACRPPSLPHEVCVRQCAGHPGGPGLSSVSRLCQHDGWVQAGRPAATAAGRPGPDDETSLAAGRGWRSQRSAEADEMPERSRSQRRRGRGWTLPALIRQTGCGGVRQNTLTLNNVFGSETKQAKTANAVQTRERKQKEIEKKKRAFNLLLLLLLFLLKTALEQHSLLSER